MDEQAAEQTSHKRFWRYSHVELLLSQIAGRVNDYLTEQPAGHNVRVTIKVWRGVWFTGGTPVLLSLTHFKTLTRLPALSLLLFP